MALGFTLVLAALAVTAVVALVHRHAAGRFAPLSAPPPAQLAVRDQPAAGARWLTAADIGVPLGGSATLVQFSTVFCAPCRGARTLLRSVAERRGGVTYVDVDAESHLDLARELGILRTPTILVLDASGVVVTRASGLPDRAEVAALLDRTVAADAERDLEHPSVS